MPKISFDAQQRVTSELIAGETAMNQTLLRQSQLLAAMVIAREESGEPFLGQDAMIALAKSQQTLLSAGGDLARAHSRLLEIGREMGRVIHDCPENKPTQSDDEEVTPVGTSTRSDGPDRHQQNVVAFK